MEQDRIRNFCIIAHIDHGKSTLADRMLELTGAIAAEQMVEQVLDQMELERERGITIKASAVRMNYRAPDGRDYLLNLIDTPGHVDFTYEVSRALAACEGALLVVDATQGVQAQTIANFRLAAEQGLTLIPVINKIDLEAAQPEAATAEVEELCGLAEKEALFTSAKTGHGVGEVLAAVCERVPPPRGSARAPLRALIFDSVFDKHRGVVAFVRVFEGVVRPRQWIMLMSHGGRYEVQEVGVFTPSREAAKELAAGEVGYIVAGIKQVRKARVGDTVTLAQAPAPVPLAGYRAAKPMVFCGLFPTDPGKYSALRDALEKLRLSDAAVAFEPENSVALGFGFRCGFLGLLHMEIVQERLEREYGLSLIATAPSVGYVVQEPGKLEHEVHTPAEFPEALRNVVTKEPFVKVIITALPEHVGPCMELAQSRRGQFKDMIYHQARKVTLIYEMPLSEILYDFFDQLKSRTSGYASYDYEFLEHRTSDLVKLTILVNREPVDALSCIVHRSIAQGHGRALVERLRKVIPRQLFEVRIQASLGSKVIAGESIPPLRKDVLAKCYGGDITRKRKLLEKQKAGKKRMKQVGHVELPQEAFMSVLKIRE